MYPDECARTSGLIIVTPTGEFFVAIGFLVMAVSTLIFGIMGWKQQRAEKRVFFIVTGFLTLSSAISFFTMLAGQGWRISPNCREVFYTQYLDLGIGTTLTIIDLALVAGVNRAVLLNTIGFNVVSSFCLYAASMSLGNVKWMWLLFGLGAITRVFVALYTDFRETAALHHLSVSELYNKISMLTISVWAVYPIVWMVGTGSNVMSPNFELMCDTALDIVAKALFGFILLMSHEALERCANVSSYKNIGDVERGNNTDRPPSANASSPARVSTVVMT